MLRRSRRRADADRGSIVVAVLVVMVASIVTLTLLTAVTNGLFLARTQQDRSSALQFASGAMDQALYLVDQNEGSLPATASGGYAPTASTPQGQVTAFTDTVDSGGIHYQVSAEEATPGNPSTWSVTATGVDASGRRREAVATLAATPIFAQPFFLVSGLSVTGNEGSLYQYSSADPSCLSGTTVEPEQCATTPIDARVGTNGTISGTGNAFCKWVAGHWQGLMLYGEATQAAADDAAGGSGGANPCGGPAISIGFATNQMPAHVPAAPPVNDGCPTVLTGGGAGGSLAPGDYVCSAVPVALTGTITVGTGGNGSGTVRIWALDGFSAAGASVNVDRPTRDFQIYEPAGSDGSAWPNLTTCDSTLFALLDTPGLSINCDGSHQPHLYGAVIAHDYQGMGNHLYFYWDRSATASVTDNEFHIENWRECPPGTAAGTGC